MFYPSQILTWWFSLGKHVAGDKERDHYRSVCGRSSPCGTLWGEVGRARWRGEMTENEMEILSFIVCTIF